MVGRTKSQRTRRVVGEEEATRPRQVEQDIYFWVDKCALDDEYITTFLLLSKDHTHRPKSSLSSAWE